MIDHRKEKLRNMEVEERKQSFTHVHTAGLHLIERKRRKAMGAEAGEETQKLKRAAAAVYDYESDPKWADYWSNILIPPHMASRSDVIDHFKRKFYQRYIDPGISVEPMSMSASSQPSRQSEKYSSSSTSAGGQSTSHSTGSSKRSAGSSATPPPNPTAMRWDQDTIQFAVNVWIFVLALLATFPLIPRNISDRTYRLAFMGTSGFSLYSVYSVYGKPGAWNMQAIQPWLQSVIATKDFIYLVYSLMFLTSHLCLKFALLPILCRSLEHVAKFLRRKFSHSNLYRKYLEEPCVWVDSNTTTLSILSSHAEVGLGFLLIISLLSWQRNIIQTFIYWQLLKLMYHSPVTSGYHQSLWAKIGRSIYPAVHRYAPFLNTPLGVIQRWWFR